MNEKLENYDYKPKKLALNSLSIRKLYEIYLNCSAMSAFFSYSISINFHVDDLMRWRSELNILHVFCRCRCRRSLRCKMLIKARYTEMAEFKVELEAWISLIRFWRWFFFHFKHVSHEKISEQGKAKEI